MIHCIYLFQGEMVMALASRGRGKHRQSIDNEGRIKKGIRRAFFGKGGGRRRGRLKTSGTLTRLAWIGDRLEKGHA